MRNKSPNIKHSPDYIEGYKHGYIDGYNKAIEDYLSVSRHDHAKQTLVMVIEPGVYEEWRKKKED